MTNLCDYSEACVLKDGTAVTVRAVRPSDANAVLEAFRSTDRDSIYTRFFTYKKSLSSAELIQITDVDFDLVVALVVTTSDGGRETLIAGGRYAVSDPLDPRRSAELAFMTSREQRGKGIARLLLDHLIRIARRRGLEQLDAVVLAQNLSMLSVFRHCGLDVKEVLQGDTVELHVPL